MSDELVRIGLLARSTQLPAWQAELIAALQGEPRVSVVLFAFLGGDMPRTKGPWPSRTVIRQRTRGKGFPHLRNRDVKDQLKGTTTIHGPLPEISDRIRNAGLDLLVDLTNSRSPGLHQLAEQGVWWFQERSAKGWESVPPGVVEHINGVHHARIDLWKASVDANPQILRTCTFLLPPERLDQTLNEVYAHLARWPAALLGHHGASVPASPMVEEDPTRSLAVPDMWQRLSAWMRSASMRKALSQPTVEWNIGLLPQPVSHLLEERPSLNVRWLPPPSLGGHRMEPFPYLDNDHELNVIYRKQSAKGPASFSRVRPKSDNNLKRSREIFKLTNGGHYPFTFNDAGKTLVVISMNDPDRTELYRLDMEHDELVRQCTLVPNALHSPTLFTWNGKWWLMGTTGTLENEALCIHMADDLRGPYEPHPMNPVRVDARGARPAGSPFEHGGKLWRPGSDTTAWNTRVVLHEVLILNEQDFQERAHTWIGPLKGSQYPAGVRTISSLGDITLVDGCRQMTPSHVRSAEARGRERKRSRSARP